MILASSMGFNKRIIAGVRYYSIRQYSFSALRILGALPLHPFLLLSPGNPDLFYCLHCFAFFFFFKESHIFEII